ncbi:hypothetical protein ADL27_38410 [Streptomyces sp. NRRL F-6602]|nr:hypothetical protein ADL27_38410 [Streptomyces sp. NRRL F-6602]
MARMTGATWRPIPVNYTGGGQTSVRGVVVHIMAGTLAGTDSWFRNSAAQASSHFGTGRSGALYQWVDTKDRAWAQADGNRSWLSVENEGKGGDALTDAQLDRNAQVLAWAHEVYGVPLQVANGPSGSGLGWHGMGGSAWGGHTSCPGSKVVAQLPEIVKRAKAIVGGSGTAPQGGSSSTPVTSSVSRATVTINGLTYGYGAKGDHVTAVGKALVKNGCSAYAEGPGPTWSDADTRSYQKWQTKCGYSGADADGVPGEVSLKKLLGKLPSKPAAKPSKPKVSLKNVIAAARRDPGLRQGGTTHAADVKVVEAALKAEKLLSAAYASDGSFGSITVAAYAKWQRSKAGGSYTGSAADGIPGSDSLKRLGARHGFTVVA